MAVYNYAEQFTRILAQKYAAESKSDALFNSNQGVTFLNAQTIKLPRLTLSGYQDHNRANIGFNTGTVTNDWEPKKLAFDRDIEFAIDPMDIDETNLALSMANIQNVFEEEQAIPERDAYAFSKLYTEYVTKYSQTASTTALTAANFLEKFDEDMAAMDDEGVPEEGRIMYMTPTIRKLAKEAQGIERSIMVSGPGGVINRKVHSLDDVELISVPSARMKTAYNFTNGFTPQTASGSGDTAVAAARQINSILVHPSAVVARQKYAYIKVFTPGTDSRTADKYIFQNRRYLDLFLLERKVAGVKINVSAS